MKRILAAVICAMPGLGLAQDLPGDAGPQAEALIRALTAQNAQLLTQVSILERELEQEQTTAAFYRSETQDLAARLEEAERRLAREAVQGSQLQSLLERNAALTEQVAAAEAQIADLRRQMEAMQLLMLQTQQGTAGEAAQTPECAGLEDQLAQLLQIYAATHPQVRRLESQIEATCG